MHSQVKASLKEKLNKEAQFIGLTTDTWTSKYQKKCFFAATLHYLNQNFEPQTISIGLFGLENNHTAESLSNELKRVLSEYDILKKTVTAVTDHASTMGAVCEKMRIDFYGCFAHLLNLIVQSFFAFIKITKSKDDEISDHEDNELSYFEDEEEADSENKLTFDTLETIEEETEENASAELFEIDFSAYKEIGAKLSIIWRKMKKIIKLMNSSVQLNDYFMQLQNAHVKKFSLIDDFIIQNFKNSSTHQLIKENNTRWNSTHDMMKRFLELNPFVEELIRRKKSKTYTKYLLDDEEVKLGLILVKLLEPFRECTIIISGETFDLLFTYNN
jgi:hypothetical protein